MYCICSQSVMLPLTVCQYEEAGFSKLLTYQSVITSDKSNKFGKTTDSRLTYIGCKLLKLIEYPQKNPFSSFSKSCLSNSFRNLIYFSESGYLPINLLSC